MEKRINDVVENALDLIGQAKTTKEIEEIRVKYLGKSGEITAFNKMMKDLPNEDKPKMGQLVNSAKERVESALKAQGEILFNQELEAELEKKGVDITLPVDINLGALHPLTKMEDDLKDFFASRGYIVYDGPEVDLYENNFDKLNIPADHPARDVQDTFYIDDKYLLRSHTSNLQVRMMESTKPPFKMVGTGRTYRGDDIDATHSPVFEQMEVLVVDKGVTMADLKTTIRDLAKHLYGENVEIRLRPSFFPFTEPSVEADVTCIKCKGKGCSICKGTGWMEILGGGMVNPKVFDACGIDSKEYTGFALGAGIERLAMSKYNLNDVRTLYENDVRFLKQFK